MLDVCVDVSVYADAGRVDCFLGSKLIDVIYGWLDCFVKYILFVEMVYTSSRRGLSNQLAIVRSMN